MRWAHKAFLSIKCFDENQLWIFDFKIDTDVSIEELSVLFRKSFNDGSRSTHTQLCRNVALFSPRVVSQTEYIRNSNMVLPERGWKSEGEKLCVVWWVWYDCCPFPVHEYFKAPETQHIHLHRPHSFFITKLNMKCTTKFHSFAPGLDLDWYLTS